MFTSALTSLVQMCIKAGSEHERCEGMFTKMMMTELTVSMSMAFEYGASATGNPVEEGQAVLRDILPDADVHPTVFARTSQDVAATDSERDSTARDTAFGQRPESVKRFLDTLVSRATDVFQLRCVLIYDRMWEMLKDAEELKKKKVCVKAPGERGEPQCTENLLGQMAMMIKEAMGCDGMCTSAEDKVKKVHFMRHHSNVLFQSHVIRASNDVAVRLRKLAADIDTNQIVRFGRSDNPDDADALQDADLVTTALRGWALRGLASTTMQEKYAGACTTWAIVAMEQIGKSTMPLHPVCPLITMVEIGVNQVKEVSRAALRPDALLLMLRAENAPGAR